MTCRYSTFCLLANEEEKLNLEGKHTTSTMTQYKSLTQSKAFADAAKNLTVIHNKAAVLEQKHIV